MNIGKSHDITMVMGDFGAKVGSERNNNIAGGHGLGTKNKRGDILIEWAQMNKMIVGIVGNTCFTQHPRRLWTRQSPGDRVRNQIDCIMRKNRFINPLLSVKLTKEQPLKVIMYQ